MRIHLINPSEVLSVRLSLLPAGLYVLAAATPRVLAIPIWSTKLSRRLDPLDVQAGDIVGIGSNGECTSRLRDW